MTRLERRESIRIKSGLSVDELLLGGGVPLRQRLAEIHDHPAYAPMIRELKEEADRLLSEPIPLLTWSKQRLFADEGSRLPYEELYFHRRRRLTATALMALLQPQEMKYMDGLLDTIWAICDEYSWCLPAHLPAGLASQPQDYSTKSDGWLRQDSGIWVDLFAAETAFALAEIRALLGERMPGIVKHRIQHEVYRRVLYPYMNMGPFGWEQAQHNWSAVCAGSISAAAIYLADDEEELMEILEKAVHSLGCFLQGFAGDGACMEGIYYWSYGFGFYVYAADLIRKRTGGALDLFADPKIREIALFQQKCFLSGKHVVNFADSDATGHVHMGLTHYLKSMYPEVEIPDSSLRARFADDHCGRWAPAVRNLLWFDPEAEGKPWGEESYWLKDAQWMISRHVQPQDVYGFAAKGGHNGEPHNHNDIGHFILHANGISVLADMGWGAYSAKYFGEERYTYICTSSEGHSVPIIAGRTQVPGAERGARVLHVQEDPSCDVLELDIAGAYDIAELQALIRRFEWHKGETPTLVVKDVYTFDEELWKTAAADDGGSDAVSADAASVRGASEGAVSNGAERNGTVSNGAALNDAETNGVERDGAETKPYRITERFICAARPDRIARNCYIINAGIGARVKVYYDADQLEASVSTLTMEDHFGKMVDYYALDFAFAADEPRCEVRFEFVVNQS